jgi:hypothetical protein
MNYEVGVEMLKRMHIIDYRLASANGWKKQKSAGSFSNFQIFKLAHFINNL